MHASHGPSRRVEALDYDGMLLYWQNEHSFCVRFSDGAHGTCVFLAGKMLMDILVTSVPLEVRMCMSCPLKNRESYVCLDSFFSHFGSKGKLRRGSEISSH